MELTIGEALQQGVAAHKEGNLQDAERLYRAILQSRPKHADANHNLGVLAVSVNKVAEALPLFKTALEESPQVEQFWLSYIEALIKEQDYDTARQIAAEGMKEGFAGDKLNALKAQLSASADGKVPPQAATDNLLEYYQSGRYNDAERLALSITQEFPEHPFGWKILGAVLRQTERLDASLSATQKSVQLAPEDFQAHNNLGITLREIGRLDEAETCYRQSITLKPDYAEGHNNLGNALTELGRLDEAETCYSQAITLKPDYAEAHFNMGNTLKALGNLEEAKESYTQAIAFKPDYVKAHNNLGNTFQELGRLEEAETNYRQAIKLNPDFAEAYNNLGVTLKALGRIEEFVESMTQASIIEPKNPKYYVFRGLSPSFISRQPLIDNSVLVNNIRNGDWVNSKKQLEKIFIKNPKFTEENLNEYIKLWCEYCMGLVNKNNLEKSLKIFVKIYPIGERNKDIDKLIKLFFEKFDVNKIFKITRKEDELLVNLILCQYYFLKGEFLQAEKLAICNIQKSLNLVTDPMNEDFGWFIVKRSLSLFKQRDLARQSLNELVNNLVCK